MCGICGILNFDSTAPVDEDVLRRMRDVSVHRGPDDAGLLREGSVGLGHRRLSILDLSRRARQPMESASGRYSITYNGEIYNYRELRTELRAEGYVFDTESDTEVLVAGLDLWGLERLLPRLDGIFAFMAWDRRERTLIGARDHLGVKPLHYRVDAARFCFASEIRSLWAAGVPREFDPDTLEELLVFRSVAGEATPFRGIRRLLPGHWIAANEHGVRIRAYWRVTDHVDQGRGDGARWRERFRAAVQAQRISDVTLGTLLSGGLDSSSITAELARISDDPLHTFTVSVPSSEGLDEAPYAEAVAARCRCRGHTVRVPADQVLERLRVAQGFHDEPLAHGNDMHIYEVSRAARDHVTVLLAGEGADETLGGYERYVPVRFPGLLRLGRSVAGAPLRTMMRRTRSRRLETLHRLLRQPRLTDLLLYNAVDLMPDDLEELGFPARREYAARRAILEEAERTTDEPIRQLMLYDMQTFLCSLLNRNDRMTMAASIECRVPFLAVDVVEAALTLPSRELFKGHRGKRVLREHADSLLPRSVITRRKWGLGIPWRRYLREDPVCRDLVGRLCGGGPGQCLDAPRLPDAIESFLAGDDRWAPLVYQLFALTVWWEEIVETPLDHAPTPKTRREQSRLA